jgi:acyl carrier protein
VAPEVRLACLPDANVFRELPGLLHEAVEVVEVELPADEPRAAGAVDVLVREPVLPLVLAGHEEGAQLAHEIARELDRRGLPAPLALAVSGRSDPGPHPPAAPLIDHSSLNGDALVQALARELDRLAEMCRAVKDFVESDVLHRDDAITPATPLVESGIVDSVSMMAIIAFVEEELGLRVPEDEAQPRNVADLLSIQRMVARLDRAR